MAVTDEQAATLRAYLAGDFETHARLRDQLDREAAATGYSALISAAFCVAVLQRFAKDHSAHLMAVSDGQVAALRRSLSAASDQDAADAERQLMHLATPDAAEGFGHLLYAAFVVAARRKFSPAWTRAALIRFVAEVRAHVCADPDDLDPAAAEHQLRTALGERIPHYPAEEARARAQVILLTALTHDLTGPELDGLLAEARTLADQLINRQHPSGDE